jgi:peroxiredoxin
MIPGLQIGSQAPAFELPDSHGSAIRLTDFRGRRLVLLFWDPDCSFCQQSRRELVTWEARASERVAACRLLVISAASAHPVPPLGLRSPVLFDPEMRVARKYMVGGTPMAVLIDEEGCVASHVAAGSWAVLSLLGQ